MKISLLLLFIGIIFSCNKSEVKEYSKKDKAEKVIKDNRVARYYNRDSIEFADFHVNENEIHLELLFSRENKKLNYLSDLKEIFLAANSDGIILDSLNSMSMNFFYSSDEITSEISSIEAIQNEMKDQIVEGRNFLNHDLIRSSILNSTFTKRIVNSTNTLSLKAKNVIVEKCHSRKSNYTENIEIVYNLNCAHLVIFF